jgi:hypothetical protein
MEEMEMRERIKSKESGKGDVVILLCVKIDCRKEMKIEE